MDAGALKAYRVGERVEQLGRSLIVYDGSLLSQIDEAMFEVSFWGTAAAIEGDSAGRGTTLVVEHDQQRWVLRHYRRGGLVGRFVEDRFVWIGVDRCRPFKEWRLLRHLQEISLPVPKPVAARCLRRGMFYTADLITEWLPDVRSLASLLNDGRTSGANWEAVGECIARFHAERVYHADLNAHNVQVDKAGRVFLLDFDRGRIMLEPGRWQQHNLARLLRSVRKVTGISGAAFEQSDWQCLLNAYRDALAGR